MTVRFGAFQARLEEGEWVSANEHLARLLNTLEKGRHSGYHYDPDQQLTMARHAIKLMGFGEIIEHQPRDGGEPGTVY